MVPESKPVLTNLRPIQRLHLAKIPRPKIQEHFKYINSSPLDGDHARQYAWFKLGTPGLSITFMVRATSPHAIESPKLLASPSIHRRISEFPTDCYFFLLFTQNVPKIH